MPSLEDYFRALIRIRPPDEWPKLDVPRTGPLRDSPELREEQQRQPRTQVSFPPQSHRVAAGVVAVTVAAAGIAVAIRAFDRRLQTTSVGPAGARNGKIAFAGSTNSELGNYDIFAINPDGSGFEQLTDDPAAEFAPAWSPDGMRIAFARESGEDPGGELSTSIYVMNADGINVRRVTTGEGVQDTSPTWSPDGSMIAFSSNREGFSDIWVVRADGTGLRQLTDLSEQGVDSAGLPAWSPDGSVIAFRRSPLEASEEPELQGIWAVEVDSGELLELTSGPSILDEDPSWSPDGRRLAFSRKIRTGTSVYTAIYVANLDEGTEIPLTRGAGEPAWSPDGTRIAFDGGRSREEFGIYVMDADGSNIVKLPTPPELGTSPGTPDWQPLPLAPMPGPTVAPTAPGAPTPEAGIGQITGFS